MFANKNRYILTKTVVSFALTVSIVLSYLEPGYCSPLEDWNALVLKANNCKLEGQYVAAAQLFDKAALLAEKDKLPDKYLPISLCRLAAAEVITNKIDSADSHFKRIVELIKKQKETNKLDPQVNFWAAALADEYLSNHKPETRELCLKRASYLKSLVYGSKHKEFLDCLGKLADCYIDEGKTDKAIETLTVRQSIIDAKDTDALGGTLYQLAIRCKMDHKFQQAKQLDLAVIKMAKVNSHLRAGLPAFYALLGMNAFSQKKISEGKEDFSLAIMEKKRAMELHYDKERAEQYGILLLPPSLSDYQHNETVAEEAELRQLLALSKVSSKDPRPQYGSLNLLSSVVDREGKQEEAITYLKEAISIAKLPDSFEKDVSELYMRLGIIYSRMKNIAKADEAFANAIAEEQDKKGFHATLILLWWGYFFKENGNIRLSTEKLNTAYEQARVLPAEKRGTLLTDLLQMVALNRVQMGREHEAQPWFAKSATELRLQKKLNTGLGPDFFHRI